MKTSNELPRVRRRRCLAPDLLEDRMVLSASQGSTFAIMPAAVTTAGQASSVPFTMTSDLFTPAAKMHGKMLLGIDVTAVAQATSATSNVPANPPVAPQITSVTGPDGRMIPIQHVHYYPKIARANHLTGTKDISSSVLLTVPVPASGQAAANYTVQVKGLGGTTGKYLLGFYLPGDTAGTGTVDKSSVATVKSLIGDAATSSNYSFDADVNRDGIINGQDVHLVQQNLGASTKVSPVVSVNLDPASDPANDRTTPYSTVHFAGKTTPGATVTFANQANKNATTSVTADSTGAYTIMVPLVSGSNTFTVTTQDAFGQSISGTISPVVYSPTSAANTPGTSSTGS
jgi:hypothetical protein